MKGSAGLIGILILLAVIVVAVFGVMYSREPASDESPSTIQGQIEVIDQAEDARNKVESRYE